jgi:hypothetical protein
MHWRGIPQPVHGSSSDAARMDLITGTCQLLPDPRPGAGKPGKARLGKGDPSPNPKPAAAGPRWCDQGTNCCAYWPSRCAKGPQWMRILPQRTRKLRALARQAAPAAVKMARGLDDSSVLARGFMSLRHVWPRGLRARRSGSWRRGTNGLRIMSPVQRRQQCC